MWKCISKAKKAILNKKVLQCTTVLTTKVSQNKECNCFLKFTPILIEHLNRYYGFNRTASRNFNEEEKNKENPRERHSFLRDFDNNVFDVLKLGGAFVLGYYLINYGKTKKTFLGFDCNKVNYTTNGIEYKNTVHYLLNFFGIKPLNNVLPQVKATKAERDIFNSLEKAHLKVLSTVNNWVGVKCMVSGENKKALSYFSQAAEGENSAAIFNLGICHEKGLGTSQNFEKAAEFYQRAAVLGHPTAMYNLGIFYIQGLGGIEPDENQARKLFEAAASLGQREAKKALSLEKQSINKLSGNMLQKDDSEDETQKIKQKPSVHHLISSVFLHKSSDMHENGREYDDKKKNINDESSKQITKINTTFDSDSGVVDLSPHNEPDVLLV